MSGESKTTTDHKKIQKWAEARNGKPSFVKGTGKPGDPGLLRINFPGGKESTLQDISWENFFEKFDENNLALLYQEKTATGKPSRFNKIISRETANKKRGSSGIKRKKAGSAVKRKKTKA
jgi:hypothetical protein